jgi:glycosyltransferase involved in cell wall biosynthesis
MPQGDDQLIRTPGLSVITPVFKGETTILRMLHSVEAAWDSVMARGENLPGELIIVLDGPDSKVLDIITQFRKECSVSLQVVTKEHSGVASARNTGLALAMYSHVTFLDCDDEITPARLEWASQWSSQIVIGLQEVKFDLAAPLPSGIVRLPSGKIERNGYLTGMIAPAERILEVGGFDGAHTPSEDLDLIMRLNERGMKLDFVQYVFVNRYVTGRNISANPTEAKAALFGLLRARKDRNL